MTKERITLRLPEAQEDALRLIARTKNLSVRDVIREAIDRYLEMLRQDEDFQQRLKTIVNKEREVLDWLAQYDR